MNIRLIAVSSMDVGGVASRISETGIWSIDGIYELNTALWAETYVDPAGYCSIECINTLAAPSTGSIPPCPAGLSIKIGKSATFAYVAFQMSTTNRRESVIKLHIFVFFQHKEHVFPINGFYVIESAA